MGTSYRPDRKGIAEMLKSAEVAKLVGDFGEKVASSLDGQIATHDGPAPITTEAYMTDRAAVAVTIAHAAGLPLEDRFGYLAKAAGDAGLEVRIH